AIGCLAFENLRIELALWWIDDAVFDAVVRIACFHRRIVQQPQFVLRYEARFSSVCCDPGPELAEDHMRAIARVSSDRYGIEILWEACRSVQRRNAGAPAFVQHRQFRSPAVKGRREHTRGR